MVPHNSSRNSVPVRSARIWYKLTTDPVVRRDIGVTIPEFQPRLFSLAELFNHCESSPITLDTIGPDVSMMF